MEKEYKMNKELISSSVLSEMKSGTDDFMKQMGNSKIKKIAEEVASKINIDEFKNVMGPLVDT
jgi:hypothetical protein